jgi:hypothetical protein
MPVWRSASDHSCGDIRSVIGPSFFFTNAAGHTLRSGLDVDRVGAHRDPSGLVMSSH